MTEPTVVLAPKQSVVKAKIVSTKNFVKKHRVAIAVTVTSIVWSSLTVRNAKQLNEFLEEHNLTDAYYNVEDDPEEAAALRG